MQRFCAFALALAAATSPLAAQATGPVTGADSLARAIDRVFDTFRGTQGPGCAVGVSRNGQLVYENGYGMANLETGTPIRPASIFHVASVSKQFTAAAILLLARDGKLSLDDNIRKHLPEIPDYGAPITIRHLLQHTSGLRDQWDLLDMARGRFEENRITEADVLDIVSRQKVLNFQPGAEYVYSNTGYTLAAVIVKRVSGQSLRDFADARIFRPLGMTSTHFHDSYTMLVPGRTSAYAPVPGGWRVSIPNYDTYGATSLYTTVGDLLKWQTNLDAPVVGDAGMYAQMQTPVRLTSGDTSAYGLGLVSARWRGAREVSHGGADAGYRSWLGRYPEHGLAVAIACNASTANTTELAGGVAVAFIGSRLQPVPAPSQPTRVPVTTAVLQGRAGAYLQPTTRQVLELVMRDTSLMVGRGPSAPALVPVGDNRMRVQGGEIVFTADGRGFDVLPASGGRPVPFERRVAATVTPTALAAFAGTYYSEELDARYRVTARDSTLELQVGTSQPIVVRPVFADGFLGGGFTIEFSRRGSAVTAFDMTNTRVRRVTFARLPSR